MHDDAPPTLTCSNCRYDLRGLAHTGHCPECAQPIAVTLAHREGVPTPGTLRAISRACYLAAAALLSPLLGAGLALATDSWPLLVIGAFISAGLWTLGAFMIEKHARTPSAADTYSIPHAILRASLMLLGLTTAGFGALLVSEIWGRGTNDDVLYSVNTFIFACAAITSWIVLFHLLTGFASTTLRSPALANRCRLAIASAGAPVLAVPLAFTGVGILLALPLLFAPLLVGAPTLVGVGRKSAQLRTTTSTVGPTQTHP